MRTSKFCIGGDSEISSRKTAGLPCSDDRRQSYEKLELAIVLVPEADSD